jgi:type II secretory pathway pseudopilin PulG
VNAASDNEPWPVRISGISLIELLVAMAIGLFVIAGAITLITTVRSTEQRANNVLELQENAAFALGVLGKDLRMANYWGLHNNPAQIMVSSAPEVFCRGQNASSQTFQLQNPVELNGVLLPCAENLDSGDRFTARYVSSESQAPDPRYVQLYTDYNRGYLHAGIEPPNSNLNAAKNFTLVVNSYFIENTDNTGVAELRRWSLGPHHKFYNELVAPNISKLNILWGEKVSDEWVWHRNATPRPLLARVEVTATSMSGGQRIEHTMAKLFQLHNMRSADNTADKSMAEL